MAWFKPDAVIGLGGGSPLDAQKFRYRLAQDSYHGTSVRPDNAGTGSEVSPNVILLDERDSSKRAVISPALVPMKLTWTRC